MSPLPLVKHALLATVLSAVAFGCTSVNKPLNKATVALEHRAKNQTRAGTFLDAAPTQASSESDVLRPTTNPAQPQIVDADGYFVGIAISGGGSRSANFSAACMFQLQRLGVLQYCDYISSVSGGSLTAAYYCAWGEEWNPGTVQKKMTHHFATDLLAQTLMPWNVVGMTVSHLDRSDLLANTLRNNLFTRKGKELTYADLRPDRPRLLINATDLQSGRPFVFSNETFDALNTDLSKYPLAYAVAASSSVPVLLHHVTLRDYSTTFKQYRHLVDGGVTDNLGIQTLVNLFEAQAQSAVDQNLPNPYPNGAIFIVLDATTQFDAKLSSKGDISLLDSLKFGAGLSSTVLINRASSATLAEMIVKHASADLNADQLRADVATLNKTGQLTMRDNRGQQVQVMHLSLSHLNNLTNLPFKSFNESVNNIATYFNIGETEAYHLYLAAELMVKDKFEKPLLEVGDKLKAANGQAR
ncbi:MAG TPA: patatin-like phospholipase family protein [Tepidisphaeraceae bacterium]|jgi:predicted acylesterase/phospholipase RssA|nr:patatin-like phospholipase family protein [Tepidisphaeraceae bacterium]